MKPSLLSVRRPVDPAAAEAFLAGKPFPAPEPPPAELYPEGEPPLATPAPPLEVAPPTAAAAPPARPDATGPALPGRRVHERKDGRRVRRTTILMREELARRFDLFAAGRGVDKTAVHEAALEAWLAAQGG